MVNKNGPIAQSMKEIGQMTKLTALVNYSTLMETYTRASGKMTKLMVKVLIHTQMEQNTSEIGRKINNMELELNRGLMVLFMKASISKAKKMGKES